MVSVEKTALNMWLFLTDEGYGGFIEENFVILQDNDHIKPILIAQGLWMNHS